jgi:tetratricopeptide (TPR) repeat protein
MQQLLTGRYPFGPTPVNGKLAHLCERLLQRMDQGPRALRTDNPAVDEDLALLVSRCLSADPEKRPASAQAVADELQRIGTKLQRRREWKSRRPLVLLAGLTALLLTVGVGWAGAWLSRKPAKTKAEIVAAAHTACDNQNFRGAVDLFDQAISAEPAEADLLFSRARARQQLGDQQLLDDPIAAEQSFDAASRDYQTHYAQTRDPKSLAGQGFCALRLAQYGPAKKLLEDALSAGFESPGLHQGLGVCRLARKETTVAAQLASARTDFENALKLDPNLAPAWHALTRVEIQLANTQPNYIPREGLKAAERALALGPPTARLYWDAASVSALVIEREKATTDTRSEAEWQPLAERAVHWIGLALDLGAPKECVASDVLLRVLRERESYRKLMASRPLIGKPNRAIILSMGLSLIDPIAD